jgi:hypothetical protein
VAQLIKEQVRLLEREKGCAGSIYLGKIYWKIP